MLSNSILLLTVSLTILMAQFSPLTSLIISIALCVSEIVNSKTNMNSAMCK